MLSEISHYIEDENGHITRVMIKNVHKGKGRGEAFYESKQSFF
jgi:hypothetical protein